MQMQAQGVGWQPTLPGAPDDAAPPGAASGRPFTIREVRLGTIEGPIVWSTMRFSPDGRRFAYVARGGLSVWEKHPARTGLLPSSAPGGTWGLARAEWAVVDGRKSPAYYEIRSLLFSPDGRHLAYAARRLFPTSWRVVVEGKAGPPYDEIEHLQFGATGRLAYAGRRDDGWFVVIDDRRDGPFEEVWSPVFSPDGARFAYAARRGGQWQIVIDGAAHGTHEALSGSLVFGPDSRRTAYVATSSRGQRVVVDDEAGAQYDKVLAGSLVFSPDGGRVAYGVESRGRQWALVDDREEGPYDRVSAAVFSPDGRRVAYAGTIGKKTWVVVDGRREHAHADIGHVDGDPRLTRAMRFSPDSRRFAYDAGSAAIHRMVVDGVPGKPYRTISGYPIFSPDSVHVAYGCSTRHRWRVVLDGREGRSYAALVRGTVVFSPDSRSLAYVGWRSAGGRRAHRVVVNEVEGPPYEAIGELQFEAPARLRAAAIHEGNIMRLEMALEEDGAETNVLA